MTALATAALDLDALQARIDQRRALIPGNVHAAALVDRPCGICGARPSRPYLPGPRCPAHAAQPPRGYCAPNRCYCPADSCTRPA